MMATIKAIIDLTDKQKTELEPLFMEATAVSAVSKDKGAIFGQAFNDNGDRPAQARFYWLNPRQTIIVNKAIIEAMKVE